MLVFFSVVRSFTENVEYFLELNDLPTIRVVSYKKSIRGASTDFTTTNSGSPSLIDTVFLKRSGQDDSSNELFQIQLKDDEFIKGKDDKNYGVIRGNDSDGLYKWQIHRKDQNSLEIRTGERCLTVRDSLDDNGLFYIQLRPCDGSSKQRFKLTPKYKPEDLIGDMSGEAVTENMSYTPEPRSESSSSTYHESSSYNNGANPITNKSEVTEFNRPTRSTGNIASYDSTNETVDALKIPTPKECNMASIQVSKCYMIPIGEIS